MPTRPPSRALLAVLGVFFLLVTAACQQGSGGDAAGEDAERRVENAELGVAVADLDPFFEVRSNEGAEIVLVPAAAEVEGTLTLRASEPKAQGGVNLVAAVEDHELDLDARSGGEFSGQRELGGPLGTAFYSRGRWDGEDGRRMEETVIFTIHPAGDRRLELAYVYPAGDDSAARVQEQLFAVFGEIVPVETPAGDGAASDSGDGDEPSGESPS